ncbi:MAG: hypothetical protein SV422_07890, partial [Pseudomonadota bacterium]|nr:hypothetical protein [Pseudomonadota bacterium]
MHRKSTQAVWRVLPLTLLASGTAFAQHAAVDDVDWELLDEYCTECHNLDDFAGSTAFDLLARDSLASDAETWELVIR